MLKENVIHIGNTEEEGLMKVSFSKLKTWRRCKRQWFYKYIEEIKKKEQAVPLKRGSWVHESLESHNRTGNWKTGFLKYKKENWDNLFDEEKEMYGDMPKEVAELVQKYLMQADDEREIISAELEYFIRVPNTLIVLTGKIDLIYRNAMGIWALDYKTCKSFPKEEVRTFDIQLALYYAVVKMILLELKIDEEVVGVAYEYLRTKPPTVPRLLKNGELSKAKNIDTDWYTYKKAIKENGLDVNDYLDMKELLKTNTYFQTSLVPKSQKLVSTLLKELIVSGEEMQESRINWLSDQAFNTHTTTFTRNMTKDCGWDCEFRNICYGELMGEDTTMMRELEFESRKREEEDDENGNNEQGD